MTRGSRSIAQEVDGSQPASQAAGRGGCRLSRVFARMLGVLALTPVLVALPLQAEAPALAAPAPAITGLHATGKHILNAAGQRVRLRGVNRTSAEYACIQGWGIFESPITERAIQAMLSWKINAVRIPLNEDCWLDVNTQGIDRQYVDAAYRNTVVDYVSRLTAVGIVVILDLHWAAPGSQKATGQLPMANRDHSVQFWTSVANTFKSNTAVIFDLFNEPYPDNNTTSEAAWRCVRDGGSCPGLGYTAAGMQELLNAVRATGATNLVMVAGVAYTGLLDRWIQYKPNDPLEPDNLAASVHIYPPGSQCSDRACWDLKLAPVADNYPLIAGEIGQTGCAHDRLDTVIDWLESKEQHYLVWAWWTEPCGSSPHYGLITNHLTGAPTSGYGQGYKDRLGALVGGAPPPTRQPRRYRQRRAGDRCAGRHHHHHRATSIASATARNGPSSQGPGTSSPVASNTDEGGRAKNRRVELVAQ